MGREFGTGIRGSEAAMTMATIEITCPAMSLNAPSHWPPPRANLDQTTTKILAAITKTREIEWSGSR